MTHVGLHGLWLVVFGASVKVSLTSPSGLSSVPLGRVPGLGTTVFRGAGLISVFLGR